MAKNEREAKDTGPLPKWDLSALFPSRESKEFTSALPAIEADVTSFIAKYQGKIGKLSGAQLGDAIEAYEKIAEAVAKVETYVELTRAADISQSPWAQDTADRLRKSTEGLLFFTLEINKMKEGDLLEKIAAPKLASYAPWIGKVRNMRDYQLSDTVEKYRHQMESVTEEAWKRLYDQLISDLRITVRGKKLTEAEAVSILDSSPDHKLRREVYHEFGKALGENKKAFALITNTLADLKAMDDRWREFEKPESRRHLDNQIEGETVDALTKTVQGNYAKTAHRYYAWKAKKAGVARLHPADRNAPLPGEKGRSYTWDEAKEIVLTAFRKISPEMADIGQEFFDKGWIDAAPRAGKDNGGFSHPAVPSAHPFILLNFFGGTSDVMTLAHELGHGIHQVLAAKQGLLKSDTPLTLAETASVFGEMIVFKELLSRETDMIAQRNMIAQKVEDMLNTVVRQTAFYTFEQKIHTERREKGELSPERISEIWQQTQKESMGPAVNLDAEGSENLWMHIPHFIHDPFYVYAYAFGDCLVNALYDEYSKATDKNDFAEKYVNLLKAGGTKRHDAALAEFGLDTADPQFWKKGLSVIERYLDELDTIDRRIEAVQKAHEDFRNSAGEVSELKRPGNDDKPHTVDPTSTKHARKGPKMGGV